MIYHTHTVQQSSKPTCWHHIVRYRRDFGTVQSPPVNWSWLNLHSLCRSHVPDPCLAPSPKAKQFTTGFAVFFFTRSEHSTPPSPLTPWENKNVFFSVPFQSLNLPPSFIPLFPPTISEWQCYQERANLLLFAPPNQSPLWIVLGNSWK